MTFFNIHASEGKQINCFIQGLISAITFSRSQPIPVFLCDDLGVPFFVRSMALETVNTHVWITSCGTAYCSRCYEVNLHQLFRQERKDLRRRTKFLQNKCLDHYRWSIDTIQEHFVTIYSEHFYKQLQTISLFCIGVSKVRSSGAGCKNI